MPRLEANGWTDKRIEISQQHLTDEGYARLVGWSDDGLVRIEDEQGDTELFAIRDPGDLSGWGLTLEDGRILEFVASE